MRIRKLASAVSLGLESILALLLAVVLVLTLGEVISRWVTHQSLVFIAELNRFLFTWLVFLAIPAVQNRGEHFRVVLLSRSLPHRARPYLEAGVDAAVLAFALVLLTQGLEIVARTSVQRSSALDVPMHYVYSVVPLSACLMVLFVALRWGIALSEHRLPGPMHSDPEQTQIGGSGLSLPPTGR
ncbi:MAG: TRAP transporter small permease [Chloroflexota bacterium]